MNANDMPTEECIDERQSKALTEVMTVLGDLPEVRDSPDRYAVVSQSGKQYEVNVAAETCTCPDHKYRDDVSICKHIHRVRYAIGLARVPEWIDEDELDDDLGEFVPTKHETDAEASSGREVATDGGAESSSGVRDDYIQVGVDSAGAHHVYRTTDETVHVIEDGERTERYDFDEMADKGINEWIVYVDDRRGWDIQELFVNMAGAVANAVRGGA